MKIGIVTIVFGDNYGNRLQNYAVQEILKKYSNNVETIRRKKEKNNNFIITTKQYIKRLLYIGKYKIENRRKDCFKSFNKNIKFSKEKLSNTSIPKNIGSKYDYFVCGSDQIWNLNYKENNIVYFLGFVKDKNKKIAFAPSFGASNIPDDIAKEIPEWIKEIPNLSVREDAGKKIIEKLTGRDDAKVLIDPTMMISPKEWDKVIKKPKILKTDKYILNYFLGEISEEKNAEINRIAIENGCEVINIMDSNSAFRQTGPSEFLYLEKNAFLICTDSFHSCVFAILYNRPFIVFDREQKGLVSMNSRIDTLLSKFKLEDRRYKGKIEKEDLTCNYVETYKILEKEREKSNNFLKKALGLQGEK